MEFFNKAKVVRLRSHLGKYLVADNDKETVRQSKNGSSQKAQWTVELVHGKNHIIRLKSCHGRYLTASDESFLLGMTGKKVVQNIPANKKDKSTEWEPIKDEYYVKLRSKDGGNFLRANGGTPPWRNSVTHDVPYRTATQDWVLWSVDIVDVSTLESYDSLPNHVSSFSSSMRDDISVNDNRSMSIISSISEFASCRQSGIEFFDRARTIRLQSHLGKYLVADDDKHTVRQSRDGSSNNAWWMVEFLKEKNPVIRLKSCHGTYLTASDEPFLLGMTGKKVVQTIPESKMDTSLEWEIVIEGLTVKLQTRQGEFLRANGGTPPWRNSITHDNPCSTATWDWVLWSVDVDDTSLLDTEPLLENTLSSYCLLKFKKTIWEGCR